MHGSQGLQLSQSGKEIRKSEMNMWTEAWLECSGFSDEETQCSESPVHFFLYRVEQGGMAIGYSSIKEACYYR